MMRGWEVVKGEDEIKKKTEREGGGTEDRDTNKKQSEEK